MSASAMLTSCKTRSNDWFADSGPTSSACWLASDFRASSEPMRLSSAFTPLAPSETPSTATTSQPRYRRGGRLRVKSASCMLGTLAWRPKGLASLNPEDHRGTWSPGPASHPRELLPGQLSTRGEAAVHNSLGAERAHPDIGHHGRQAAQLVGDRRSESG